MDDFIRGARSSVDTHHRLDPAAAATVLLSVARSMNKPSPGRSTFCPPLRCRKIPWFPPITPTPVAPGARPNTPRPLSEADCPISPKVNPAAPVAVAEPSTAAIELPVPFNVAETPPVAALVVTVVRPYVGGVCIDRVHIATTSTSPPEVMLPVVLAPPGRSSTAPPLCVMIESLTSALPPVVAKSGTEPAWHAVLDEQTISFCAAEGMAQLITRRQRVNSDWSVWLDS